MSPSPFSRIEAADLLLGPLPSRMQLKRMDALPVERTIGLRVERSMPFEFIAGAMSPFLQLWGFDCTIAYSDYDPALSQIDYQARADAFVFWIDWRLYSDKLSPEAAKDWLAERIEPFRRVFSKPLLFNNWPERSGPADAMFSPLSGDIGWFRQLNAGLDVLVADTPGSMVIDLASLSHSSGFPFFDVRNDEFSHYPFSDKASIAVARHLGVHLFPALFLPRIKAIALDLDDTLYAGVLGEDGYRGIKLTEGHIHLQNALARLKRSGIMLTLCTRNEEDDVRELFSERKDFPLAWEDFAAIAANWQPKHENVRRLAKTLHITESAFLLIDDNAAELAKMAGALPEVKLLRADSDAFDTVSRLCNVPGLYLLRKDDSASLRTEDIQANQTRERLKEAAGDFDAYLQSLEMTMRIFINHPQHVGRLHELGQKTNQFNLTLYRMSEPEAEQCIKDEAFLTMTVQLSDKLTDSGVIGAFVAQLEGDHAVLRQVLLSCRALGRGIETVSFAVFLGKLIDRGVKHLQISAAVGPRNAPAREWLSDFAKPSGDSVSTHELRNRVLASCANHPAKIEEVDS